MLKEMYIGMRQYCSFCNQIVSNIWDKVFKNGSSKFFSELSSTNFTRFIPEYFFP